MTLHVPLDKSTHNLIGERELAMMKPTAILINTCRGPVVDEKALYMALRDEKILGAGLDVMVEEPPKPDHELFTLKNAIFSPHGAGPTWDNHGSAGATPSTISSASRAARSRSGSSPNCGSSNGDADWIEPVVALARASHGHGPKDSSVIASSTPAFRPTRAG